MAWRRPVRAWRAVEDATVTADPDNDHCDRWRPGFCCGTALAQESSPGIVAWPCACGATLARRPACLLLTNTARGYCRKLLVSNAVCRLAGPGFRYTETVSLWLRMWPML
jgi:hypothetical protein